MLVEGYKGRVTTNPALSPLSRPVLTPTPLSPCPPRREGLSCGYDVIAPTAGAFVGGAGAGGVAAGGRNGRAGRNG
jgi:hypothetical protein